MNISVEYKDTAGTFSNRTYRMSRLAFAKHLAIVGQGYAPTPQKLYCYVFSLQLLHTKAKQFTTTDFLNPQFNFPTRLKKDNFQFLQVNQCRFSFKTN